MLDVGVLVYDFPNLRFRVLDHEGAEVPGRHFIAPGSERFPAFVKHQNQPSRLRPVVLVFDFGTHKRAAMKFSEHPAHGCGLN